MEKAQKTKESRKTRSYYIPQFVLLLLIETLFIAIYTVALQQNNSNYTLKAAVERDIECSNAIHKTVNNQLTREDFADINQLSDMDSERYQELQAYLNELRSLNSTRYLYTAKRNEEGRLVYLIDGLDLGAEDFAYPGTYIEEEMIPYLESALAGETIYSQEIIDTTWGHIFTACYPVVANDGTGDIIGALCIEMDMETTYEAIENINRMSVGIAAIAIIVAVILSAFVYGNMQKQKQKEQQQQRLLEETANAAEKANQAKSTFLFNMSHDLRTPMNAILGYTDLATEHLHEPEKLEGYMNHIRASGEKLLSIINSVLELARIENNQTVIEESAIKAGEGFDSCIVMFTTALKEKNQTLTVEKDIYYPYIYIDNAHVSEIVLNIISNAIKYTGNDGNIHCILRQKPGEKEGFCITEIIVSDDGIGMSEEFQKHIFEAFSRERSSTVSGVPGTGLGMGIVKKLVDLMHGTIEVESRLGEGSAFTVRIPCRIAGKEDIQEKAARYHLDKESIAGKRILLTEDNELNAEIATELLKEEGLLVDRANDGVVCVEMMEKTPAGYYDLILMDVQMPIMDGYKATQAIRRMQDPVKAGIPIIAMTANAFAEDRQRAFELGMNDHVAKPIDRNALILVLERWLHAGIICVEEQNTEA